MGGYGIRLCPYNVPTPVNMYLYYFYTTFILLLYVFYTAFIFSAKSWGILFPMKTYSKIPESCTRGDTLNIVLSGGEYPAPEYSLTLTFVSPGAKLSVTSAPSGNDHSLQVDTTHLAAGRNDWQLKITGTGYSRMTRTGVLTVAEDFASLGEQGLDNRNWLDKAIEALEAAIAGTAHKDQLMTSIDGVTVQRMPLEQKISALKSLEGLRISRNNAAAKGRGRARTKIIGVRF